MVTLYLRQENSDFVLLESSDKIVLEENTLFAVDSSAASSTYLSASCTFTQDTWSDVPQNTSSWITSGDVPNTWNDSEPLVSDLGINITVPVITNNAIYTSSTLPEHFLVFPNVSPRFVFSRVGDVIDLPYPITFYTITSSGNVLYFTRPNETVPIPINGDFLLRTMSGSAFVRLVVETDPFRVYVLIGDQEVNSPSFNALAGIENPNNISLVKAWY